MKVKIDTKEKFHVIRIEEPVLSANMTGELSETLLSFQKNSPQNLIVDMELVAEIDLAAANALVTVQQTFYDANSSMVICNLQPNVETYLDEQELLELMNVTPTVSEAWDIVQMEEIEREIN
jgi:anti-anti-sigma regulatory factor